MWPDIPSKCSDKSYSGEQQEDASECLMMLIELINKGSVPYCGSDDNNSTGVSLSHIKTAFLLLKYTLSKRHTYQSLMRPCWCIRWFDTVWFQVCFQLYVPVFSMSWYGYRYLWHCTLVSSTPFYSIMICNYNYFLTKTIEASICMPVP